MKTPRYSTSDPDFAAAFARLCTRGDEVETIDLEAQVKEILKAIAARGDEALVELTARFDRRPKLVLAEISIDERSSTLALSRIDRGVRTALERAAARIAAFHGLQRSQLADLRLDDQRGVVAELIVRPLERVGIYVPGGTAAYPSTVLMNAIPAKVAGVPEVLMVTPAMDGRLSDAVLAAAQIAGVDRIFTIGGAQAIGALAFGTKTVPRVDKIVGPGNAWVQEAKRQVFGRVDIDNIAGPSEVLIVADSTASPEVVAADLLAQAEHDVRAAAVLITWDPELADRVQAALERRVSGLPRSKEATQAIESRGGIVLAADRSQALALADRYAPEHLGLAIESAESALDVIANAGAIFVGHHTPEALGDYNAGVNHVLPTSGTARFASPLSIHDFIKRTSVLKVDHAGLSRLGPDAALLARTEGLEAHAQAIEARKRET